MLGRPLDPSGRLAYGSLLSQGLPRLEVVYSVVRSVEARRDSIAEFYEHYLDRSEEPAGMDFWEVVGRAR